MYHTLQLFEFEDLRNTPSPIFKYKLAIGILTSMLIILSVIAIVSIFGTPNDYQDIPEIRLKITLRAEWNATNFKNKLKDLKLPVDRFIIAHTTTRECFNKTECSKIVREIQRGHMQPPMNYDDIGFNFLIGGDGNIYEGRGWTKVGAHTKNFNSLSLGVTFIGDFEEEVPNEAQLKAGFKFFDEGLNLGFMKSNFSLFGQNQFDNGRYKSPGKAFYKIIQKWNRWSDKI